ncbi:hypothetical protein [Acetobacterium bakii]
MNVLVAEDEKDIRNLLRLHLEEAGYTVFFGKRWHRSPRGNKEQHH